MDNLYQAPVNNMGIDPLQGFDFECWCQDVASGKIAWFGKFQSLTLSVRNATETYLELGQRVPTYLDGEIQIAWVLEQGLVDMAFIYRTFGVKDISRDQVIGRSPRFQITFDANAAELAQDASIDRNANQILRMGSQKYSLFNDNLYPEGSSTKGRAAVGRYEVLRCKVDSVSLGIMPGRRTAALRWEGVAEGIRYIANESKQEFKTSRVNAGQNSGGFTNIAGTVDLTR